METKLLVLAAYPRVEMAVLWSQPSRVGGSGVWAAWRGGAEGRQFPPQGLMHATPLVPHQLPAHSSSSLYGRELLKIARHSNTMAKVMNADHFKQIMSARKAAGTWKTHCRTAAVQEQKTFPSPAAPEEVAVHLLAPLNTKS